MKGLTEVAVVRDTVAGDQKEYFGLKLWQIGLLLGIPSALAVFYFYSRGKSEDVTKEASEEAKKQTVEEKKAAGKKPEKPRIEDLSPLEKAVEIKNLGMIRAVKLDFIYLYFTSKVK